MTVTLRMLALAIACFALPSASISQPFPAKPVHFIVPMEPGTLDYYLRLISPKLQEGLGQPVVIEYRSGAGGVIGAQLVARAAPDGYTVLFTTPGTNVTLPFLSRNVPYDPVADFTPITAFGGSWLSVLAHPSVPVATMADLIEYARRNPGKISYASNGVGGNNHLAGEQIKLLTGIDIVHVPYKGGAPALSAVIAGETQIAINSIGGSTLPSIQTGKIKALAVIGTMRHPALANTPLIGEVIPGYEAPPAWIAFFGPARLQKPVLDRLANEIIRAANVPEVREKSLAAGVSVIANTPEQFAAMFKNDVAVVARLVKAAGIKPE
jgi:tripartite-type tricarboxylate transporter receptor subunit TctC